MPKTGDTSAIARGDLAFSQRRKVGMPEAQVVVTAPQEQLRRAGQEPMRWCARWVISPW